MKASSRRGAMPENGLVAAPCFVGICVQAASPTLVAAAATTERRDNRVPRITSNDGPFIASHANVASLRRLAPPMRQKLQLRYVSLIKFAATLVAASILTSYDRGVAAPAAPDALPDLD